MSKTAILECRSDSFGALVKESLNKTGVRVSPSVKNYLSELMRFYMLSDRLFFVDSSGKKRISTLAELYLQGQSSGLTLKRNLKKMGDISLYVSGFFREFLRKKPVSEEYYINMGRQAYQSLFGLQEGSLFEELALRFSDLTMVLFQIQRKTPSRKPENILQLLDQYMETGSGFVARDLISQGIDIPFKKDWKKRPH